MPDRSGGPLFEFELAHRSDQEIWIKHIGTEHTYQFVISDDGLGLRDEHTVVPNTSSTIDPAMFATPARRAALAQVAKPAKPPSTD